MSQVTYPLGMPKDLLREVKHAAKETGLSVADVMRQAIKFGVPRVRQAMSRGEDLAGMIAGSRHKGGLPPDVVVTGKLVKHGNTLIFELPGGGKIDPEGIAQAVREERDAQSDRGIR